MGHAIAETERQQRKVTPKELKFRVEERARLKTMAKIQQQLVAYRAAAAGMELEDFIVEAEKKHTSATLARLLPASG